MLFEVVGTPTLILFHNGIPAAKFLEEHFTLYELARFIINITGVYTLIKYFVQQFFYL